MDSHCLLDSRIHVIIHSCLLEVFLHWEYSPRDFEDRSPAKESREFFSIHGRGSDDDLDISSLLSDLLENAEQDISVKTSLMGLVHDDG
jgi:hypothetical protein